MTEHAFPPLYMNNKRAIEVLLLSPGAPVSIPLPPWTVEVIFCMPLLHVLRGLIAALAHGECRVSLGPCGSPTVFLQSRSVLLHLHTCAFHAPLHPYDSYVIHIRCLFALDALRTLFKRSRSSRKMSDGRERRGPTILVEKKLPRGGVGDPSIGISFPAVPTVGAFEPGRFPFRKGNETGGTSIQSRNVAPRVGVGARTLVHLRHVSHGRTRRFAWDEEAL